MFSSRFLVLAALCFSATSVSAHEFWVEPVNYQVENGETLEAHFKNGQKFVGSTLSFFDRSSLRFDFVHDGEVSTLAPRSGDKPALNIPAPAADSLVVVVHETTPSHVTYNEWAKFLKFAAHKDFASAAADHEAAGWSKVKFKERYTRHAKALIAVGTGAGEDKSLGLETEFVVKTNPYSPGFDNQMEVLLTFRDTPRGDAQVEVFERGSDDSVTITLYRTNAEGIAVIPVKDGHEYLFDAVVLQATSEATAEENATVWETYWAALTFAVPQ